MRREHELLGPDVGGELGALRLNDGTREASQVLDQADAQHDRYGPRLADGQRRDLLVAGGEPREVLLVEAGVGVRDQREYGLVDTRKVRELAADQSRQLEPVVSGQVRADEQDLLLDEVVVVEQPLARRRGGPPVTRRGREFAVVRGQRIRGLLRERYQWRGLDVPARGAVLSRSQSSGLNSDTLRREELGSQRRLAMGEGQLARGARLGHVCFLRRPS